MQVLTKAEELEKMIRNRQNDDATMKFGGDMQSIYESVCTFQLDLVREILDQLTL